jgi:hypothetical protein
LKITQNSRDANDQSQALQRHLNFHSSQHLITNANHHQLFVGIDDLSWRVLSRDYDLELPMKFCVVCSL